ncbi:aspartate aminotransferase family protein [Clostridiaceae bacterium 35-E11]
MRKIENCMKVVEEDIRVIPKFTRSSYYPLVVKKGHGSIVEDADGNKYIDFLSSAAVLNVGSCHPKVVQAIIDQTKELIHYTPGYMYLEEQVDLAKKLITITPGKYKKKVAFGLSGSDALDGVIKLARAYTGRNKIISFTQSYHGSTYGAISVSTVSLNMRRKIGPLLPDIFHANYPDCYRCVFGKNEENCNLECLEQLKINFKSFLPPEEVGGIIVEPIAGDAGLVIPPQKYMDELYNVCKENKILFISDEVQQGFGRTGKWFGIENYNIVPDIIAMGKGIASGMPLSAIAGRDKIMKSLEDPAHLFTMSGNPITCKAALATIQVIEEENLLEYTRKTGAYVKESFLKMKDKYSIIGDVRGLGLSIGVDLIKNKETKERNYEAAAKICYRCWEKGLILTFFANSVLRIQPPLNITKKEIDTALEIIEEAMTEYLNGNIPDKVLEVAKGW